MRTGSEVIYQKRLLLYADILGWTAEIKSGDQTKLLSAVNIIHARAKELNEQERERWRTMEGKVIQTDLGPGQVSWVNPMALEVQFGAFSDHFLYSLPASFGSRIYSAARELIVDLLKLGFLVRGAVTYGDLYHQDNVVFGPALLEAVDIEEQEAFYPRILISEGARIHCAKSPGDERYKIVIHDQMGRNVINPFALPFTHSSDEMVLSTARQFFPLDQIKSTVDAQIAALEKADQHRAAEKWRYFDRLVDGPVLDAAPQLRSLWR